MPQTDNSRQGRSDQGTYGRLDLGLTESLKLRTAVSELSWRTDAGTNDWLCESVLVAKEGKWAYVPSGEPTGVDRGHKTAG
jgi:hypothetical protein